MICGANTADIDDACADSLSARNAYANSLKANMSKKRDIDRQCHSCGGFCKQSGCERENTPIITSSDVIAGLEMALSQAAAMIDRQQHVMQRAMDAWDTTTHQKNGDGRLWQCMEELRMEVPA